MQVYLKKLKKRKLIILLLLQNQEKSPHPHPHPTPTLCFYMSDNILKNPTNKQTNKQTKNTPLQDSKVLFYLISRVFPPHPQALILWSDLDIYRKDIIEQQ